MRHWQNPTALAVGYIPTYTAGAPSQTLRWTSGSSQPLQHHRGFLLATSSTDIHHCRYFLYLLRALWVGWDPWWELLPSDPVWGRAASEPSEWPYHIPSCCVWQHGRTSDGG